MTQFAPSLSYLQGFFECHIRGSRDLLDDIVTTI